MPAKSVKEWLMNKRMWLPIVANGFLFFSSLLLLIDLAPRDYLASYKSRRNAIEALREANNIVTTLPAEVTIKGSSPDFRFTTDPHVFEILRDFIHERSPVAHTVRWQDTIGVGFMTYNVEVLKPAMLDVFQPLYIVEVSPDSKSSVIKPVGQLADLDSWLSSWRRSSLTNTALGFLIIGFFLQLLEACFKLRVPASGRNNPHDEEGKVMPDNTAIGEEDQKKDAIRRDGKERLKAIAEDEG